MQVEGGPNIAYSNFEHKKLLAASLWATIIPTATPRHMSTLREAMRGKCARQKTKMLGPFVANGRHVVRMPALPEPEHSTCNRIDDPVKQAQNKKGQTQLPRRHPASSVTISFCSSLTVGNTYNLLCENPRSDTSASICRRSINSS